MEADELDLLDKSVRHALTTEADTDAALEALGWRDVLAGEPRAAVSVVFTALGELDASASSLADVMLHGLDEDLDTVGATIAFPAMR